MIPDNYSAFEAYDVEQERQNKINKHHNESDEIKPEDLPFYYDDITIREMFGKGIKPCLHYMN